MGRYKPEVCLDRLLQNPIVREVTNRLAAWQPGSLYLVGGALRDACLGRPIQDMDFVVPGNARTCAQRLSEELDARCVILDENWGVARLILPAGEGLSEPTTLDFATLQGTSIEEDLSRRDFTCNAMALDLGQDASGGRAMCWKDPEGGGRDIEEHRVRWVRSSCFRDDPVRMLRAFRLASQLHFSLEEQTLRGIGTGRHLILSSAAERVGDELFKLFRSAGSFSYLAEMARCGLLTEIMPELASLKNLGQGRHHHLDVWTHTLETYRLLECAIDEGFPELGRWAEAARAWVQSDRKTAALLKMTALLHDIGKPATRRVETEEEIHFYGHAALGSEMAVRVAERLRLSRRDQERVRLWVRYHLGPLKLFAAMEQGRVSERAKIRFLRKLGPDAAGVLVLSVCDLKASRGEWTTSSEAASCQRLIDSLFELLSRMTAPGQQGVPLLSGNALMTHFDLLPGPLIGRLLRRVEEERIQGGLHTREEALEFVRKLLEDASFSS